MIADATDSTMVGLWQNHAIEVRLHREGLMSTPRVTREVQSQSIRSPLIRHRYERPAGTTATMPTEGGWCRLTPPRAASPTRPGQGGT